MIQGTTPTFTFTIRQDTVNLDDALKVIVTIKQSTKRIDLTGDDISVNGRTVSLYLSQEQSLKLSPGRASVQINWTYPNPKGGSPRRASTKPKCFSVDEQFYERVIE